MPTPPKHNNINTNPNFLWGFGGKERIGGVYEYSFQAQEHDDEIKGPGNSINYKYRMHDTRLGRFFSVDPLAAKYPWNSPYAFSENRVIDGVELEGLEYVNSNTVINEETGETFGDTYGDLFDEDNTVNYNGTKYYRVNQDLFLTEDNKISFSPGENNKRITEWIYPEIQLASEEDYIDHYATHNCFTAAWTEAEKIGARNSNKGAYSTTVQMINTGNGPRNPDKTSMRIAINMIHYSLEMGIPIVVGIDYDVRRNGGNYDKTTDHFVVITGRGHDEYGNFFLYHDNAAFNNNFYKLYVESGLVVSKDSESFIGEGAKVSNIVMNLQLLEIYLNPHLSR